MDGTLVEEQDDSEHLQAACARFIDKERVHRGDIDQ
jgi:hypothetical protein